MIRRILLTAALAAAPLAARAQSAGTAAAPPAPAAGLWQRDTLSGDWGGLRTRLAAQGVTVALIDSADLLANLAGGIKTGTGLENQALGQVDVDLDRLAGWTGGHLRVTGYAYDGHGLSESNVGTLLGVSDIEAPAPTLRIWELWLEQSAAGGAVALRAGLLALDSAGFAATVPGGLFIGSSIGFPAGLSGDLPGDGPAYPLSAPGVLLTLRPAARLRLMAAVLSGDASGGPGATFPLEAYPTGTVFSTSGGVLAITQAALTLGHAAAGDDVPATVKLGAWYDSSRHFTDLSTTDLSTTGLATTGLATTGAAPPRRYRGDWGVFGTIEGTLWRGAGAPDGGLSGFLRVTLSPPPSSLFDRYVDGGFVWKGLVPGRADDLAGLAVAYAHISDAARAADRAMQATDPAYPVRDEEMVLELTYQAAVAPWWVLQPVGQYWFHPGGGVPNPGGRLRRQAVVAGLRTDVTF